jgi:hypothetical protein
MSFIVALASAIGIFSLQRSKRAFPARDWIALLNAFDKNLRRAVAYAKPSNVLPAHGSIQMPYENFRSAVFS